MATIQVRDIPQEAYDVLARRARAEGRSLQSYMREQVVAWTRRPTADEVFADLERALRASDTPGATRGSVLADLGADRR